MLFFTKIDMDNASHSSSIVGLGDAFAIDVDTKFDHFPV